MKTVTKFWLGILTFLPLVLLIAFFILFFSILFDNLIELRLNNEELPIAYIQSLVWLIPLILIIALISLGVKIFYIVHTNNNELNDTTKKIIWTLLLIFGGTIASIVYYFMEITPLKKPNQEIIS